MQRYCVYDRSFWRGPSLCGTTAVALATISFVSVETQINCVAGMMRQVDSSHKFFACVSQNENNVNNKNNNGNDDQAGPALY